MSMFNSLFYDMLIQNLVESNNISIDDAKKEISKLSFAEYHRLSEANGSAIVPPSGNTIGPTTQGQQNLGQQNTPTSKAPVQMKAIWPGKGAPIEMGMTVGLKGPNGLPVPGEITQVDATSKGVKVKNPTSGQDEWMNIDTLQPFVANAAGTANSKGTQNITSTEESAQLMRLRELAGIREDSSGGATSAGAVAIAPASIGTVKKRQGTEEGMTKREHTPKGPPKTIVGDTKPMQNSGQLSSTLAANGKPTATRQKRK